MNRILKFKWEERNKIFFASDWHNRHDPQHWNEPIWKMRGYDSVEHAFQDTISKVNAKVGKDDHLFFLGDGFLNSTDEQVEEWFSKINCQNLYYLFGNHESNVFRIYREQVQKVFGFEKDIEVYPFRYKNVVFLGNYQEIQVGKKDIVFCHFPIHSWNKMDRKSWMISGHQHNSDPSRNPDCPQGLCVDVGWDWKRDVWSFQEIEEVMACKNFKGVDHHV